MKHYETHAIAAIVAIVAIVPGKCRWTRWPTGIPRGSLAHLPSLSLWVYAEWSEWLELALSRGSILRYIMILYDIILCVYIYICYTVYHCILRTLGMRAPLGFSSASARLQLGFSSSQIMTEVFFALQAFDLGQVLRREGIKAVAWDNWPLCSQCDIEDIM